MGREVVVWERWVSLDVDHTCDRCRDLDGQLFREGEGRG